MTRISAVQQVIVREVGYSSFLFVGDCVAVRPVSRALAIQRQTPNFYGNEGSFEAYEIFSKPIPLPLDSEAVHMETVNRHPIIQVQKVDIVSISSSSVVQLGSNRTIEAETRTKHIRHLRNAGPSPVTTYVST
ncbi:MAG: spore germination protein [Paenibacillus sp.]|jgi:spore germination protein PE|nr:spore germination protein [Paenibacillus sp.]